MKRIVMILFVAMSTIVVVAQKSLTAEQLCQKGHECYDKENYVEAVKWYTQAAKKGYAEAQRKLGICYHYGNGVEHDYVEAVKWYRKAAEQGSSGAQVNLGYCYDNGLGVEQDYAEAVKWYRKAAEQGDVDAQFSRARLCGGR